MSPLGVLGFGLLLALALETLAWLVSLARRDASVADVLWGPGFAALAWLYHAAIPGRSTRGLLVAGLVTIWGLRLALHIAERSRGRGEDPRYAAMRRAHGERFPAVSLVTVFWLQGLILWVVALPLFQAQRGGPLGWGDALGLTCVVAGFLCEAVADRQLQRFRADPANRGRVLDTGLWRYSRHPNYFGDALLWWGLFALTAANTEGWWTVVSPLVMTFLLVRVSGVPLLERGLADRRPGYAEYVRRTSAFVPWFPRKAGAPH
jgi:steroid 5-alpha reductase family enzyme